MSSDKNWKDLPATKKQIKFLTKLAIESFSFLSRGEASRMIEHWLRVRDEEDIASYDSDTLEENK